MKKYNPSTTAKTTSVTFRCPNELKIKIDCKIKRLNGEVGRKTTQTDWIVSVLENEIKKDQKDL